MCWFHFPPAFPLLFIAFSLLAGVWDKILQPVASVRKSSEMLQLFSAYLKGEDLFGLTVSAVARIAESVSGRGAAQSRWLACSGFNVKPSNQYKTQSGS